MSGINGDKARFNRERKKKIARRLRKRAMLQEMGGEKESTARPAGKSARRSL